MNGFMEFQVAALLYSDGDQEVQIFSQIHVTGWEVDLFFQKRLKTIRKEDTLVIQGLEKESTVLPCGVFAHSSGVEVEVFVLAAISLRFDQITSGNILKLKFSAPIKSEEIVNIYYDVLVFFKFITGRQNISLDKFQLLTDDKYLTGIYVKYLNYSKDTHPDVKKTIIPYNVLRTHTGTLFQMVHKGSFLNHYYPEKQKSRNSYTPSREIFLLTNFEKEFREIYGVNVTRSEEYSHLKADGEKFLKEWIANYTGKQKERAKKLAKAFTYLDVSYAERIYYALLDCADILEPFLQDSCFVEQIHEGSEDVFKEISDILAEIRNDYAHGNLIYEDETINIRLEAIMILDRLLYAMRLKFIGLSTQDSKKAINILFQHHLYFN